MATRVVSRLGRVLAMLIVMAAGLGIGVSVAQADGPVGFQYISPMPGSSLHPPGTTIAVRHGDMIDGSSVSADLFEVVGNESGIHSGRAVLSADGCTVIFVPDQPFALGERVNVTLRSGLRTKSGGTLPGQIFDFQITPKVVTALEGTQTELELLGGEREGPASSVELSAQTVTLPRYETAPASLPVITMTLPSGTDSGYVFLAPYMFWPSVSSYLLILEDAGELVYYQELPAVGYDFKKQPNGLLTFYDSSVGYFRGLDPSYTVVDTYAAGNGYVADVHDLQVLPENGHALLLIYDFQTMDLTEYGGRPDATVIGLIVQELDAAKNVVFQWRSWDYIDITDTVVPLTSATVDYVHGNAVERDHDGNLLISARHLWEVTKVNRQTGEVMWRWGGKRNEFTFTNDDPFYYQHDIRRLANGHVTLFDNGNARTPPYSRVVEFELDEENKVATSEWEYRNSPDTFSPGMGNAQRLPNGNTLIGWGGSSDPAVIEAKPDGTKAFELSFTPGVVSYRTFRFPWQGFPSWAPTALLKKDNDKATLYFSWNGATNVAYYRIYAGKTADTTNLIATKLKSGFEESFDVTGFLDDFCYYRVMPVDNRGQTAQYSNLVSDPACAHLYYLPLVTKKSE